MEEFSQNLRSKIENAVGLMAALRDAVEEALEEIRIESIGADEKKREILKETAEALQNSFSGFDMVEGTDYCLDPCEGESGHSGSSEGHLSNSGDRENVFDSDRNSICVRIRLRDGSCVWR